MDPITLDDLNSLVEEIRESAEELIVSMKKPVVCDGCGYVCEDEDIPVVQVVSVKISGRPEDCHPGDWEAECPSCGSRESFSVVDRKRWGCF